MNYVIVDFEMNLIAREEKEAKKICGREIIEIGAVILDEQLVVMGEFKTLVKPQYSKVIYPRYESLTGISTNMVVGAPVFNTAYEMFVNWCESYGEDYEVYAWSENDYNQLVAEMELKGYYDEAMKKPLTRWYDFQKEYMNKLGLEKVLSLEKAVNYAGMEFQGKIHDALWDAKNTAELFAIVRDEKECNRVLNSVIDAFQTKKVTSTLGELFDFEKLLAQLA